MVDRWQIDGIMRSGKGKDKKIRATQGAGPWGPRPEQVPVKSLERDPSSGDLGESHRGGCKDGEVSGHDYRRNTQFRGVKMKKIAFKATPNEKGVAIELIGGPFQDDVEVYETDHDGQIQEIISNKAREYFYRACGIHLAQDFWEDSNIATEEKPDRDALTKMLYNDNLMLDYHDIMTQDDFDSVELGFCEYFEKEL
jgi:hypothetical protein